MANDHRAPYAVRSARGPYGYPGDRLAWRAGRCYGPGPRPYGLRRERTMTEVDEADRDDIAAAARGDQKALGRLYDRHAPQMMAVAVRMLKRPREAEDLVHDTFLEVWRAAKDYDPARGSVRAWIMMRVRSRSLDLIRKRGRNKVVLDKEGRPLDGVASDIDPTMARDTEVMGQAFQTLPEEQRAVLRLAYFGGLSSPEIAAELHIPIGTVKSRVARGLAALRVAMADPLGGAS